MSAGSALARVGLRGGVQGANAEKSNTRSHDPRHKTPSHHQVVHRLLPELSVRVEHCGSLCPSH